MARSPRKHSQQPSPPPTSQHRSSSVAVVALPSRKLFIFMSLQLVLSPFILITADTLNESIKNKQATLSESVDLRYGSTLDVNCIKMTNCTGDDFLTDNIQTTATQSKSANRNSILKQSEITENGKRPYDVDLSSTGSISMHNQSRQTNATSDSRRMKLDVEDLYRGGERVLSRKRRYLIFPPGSAMQIGDSIFLLLLHSQFYLK